MQLGIGIVGVRRGHGRRRHEFAEVEVHDDGTHHGQGGHVRARAGSRHGVHPDRRRPARRADGADHYVQSDTALVARGGGTGGSRSVQLGGTAVLQTSKLVRREGEGARGRAARGRTRRHRRGRRRPPRRRGRARARRSRGRSWRARRPSVATRSWSQHDTERSGSTFPFGAHVAVVEVDTETGRVEPRPHIAVDDCGVILNPLLVDGQVHGGLASGHRAGAVGADGLRRRRQPAHVHARGVRDPERGRAAVVRDRDTETPSPLNELGAKGIGESGTIGSTPAVQNAVVDALSHLGVRHVDMPCTPERVWRGDPGCQGGHARGPVARAPGRDVVAPGRRRRRRSPRTRSRGDQPVSEAVATRVTPRAAAERGPSGPAGAQGAGDEREGSQQQLGSLG